MIFLQFPLIIYAACRDPYAVTSDGIALVNLQDVCWRNSKCLKNPEQVSHDISTLVSYRPIIAIHAALLFTSRTWTIRVPYSLVQKYMHQSFILSCFTQRALSSKYHWYVWIYTCNKRKLIDKSGYPGKVKKQSTEKIIPNLFQSIDIAPLYTVFTFTRRQYILWISSKVYLQKYLKASYR